MKASLTALLILSLGLKLIDSLSLRLHPAHDYWFNKDNPKIKGNDYTWDYCDLKCLYLQKYAPGKDFVVVVMGAVLKDTFAACYVKNGNKLTLWSSVLENSWFEKQCGNDYKDWVNIGEFNVISIYGEGIGREIGQDEAYQ